MQARERVVEVLACNWDALRVYQHCQPTVVGGGFGVVYLGVSAAECRAAIALLGIRRTAWADVLASVQEIGQIVAGEINRRSRR